jgi:quinol monooxygenase YgiN
MIVVVGRFRLPVTVLDEARTAMARVVELSRAEEGCLAYDYAEDLLEAGLFRVSERWTSRAALDAHFATAHMARWKREREALGLTDRHVVAYEAEDGEAL